MLPRPFIDSSAAKEISDAGTIARLGTRPEGADDLTDEMRPIGTSPSLRAPEGILATDVTKTFRMDRRGRTVLAVDEFNLKAPRGSFVACLGPSGCGKSTMLRILAGLDDATSGSVLVSGRTPETARKQHRIGVSFQDAALLPWRTVRDNVALPLEIAGLKRFDHLVDPLIDLVGLSQFTRARPRQLSGGMRQRVSIARALVLQPQILLLDEPFGALDEMTREQLMVELQRIWMERVTTTFFVTHSVIEAVFLADLVVLMTPHPGRIAGMVEIGFPRPRTLDIVDSAEFGDACHECRTLLRSHDDRG